MRFRNAIGVVVALAMLCGCGNTLQTSADAKVAPDFTLKDDSGKQVTLSSFKGKPVLLNFWATWCGPCKVEIPWFIEFQQTYRDQGLVVLGVSMDDDGWKSVKPYMTEKKINYRILLGNEDVAKKYDGLESLPTTIMIDKAGRIAAKHVGLISKTNYKSEIESLINASVQASNPVSLASNLWMRAN